MVMYREVCPEGVQNKCPGGVWCRGFMSWGDTLILVISRGVQLYYGIAHSVSEVSLETYLTPTMNVIKKPRPVCNNTLDDRIV